MSRLGIFGAATAAASPGESVRATLTFAIGLLQRLRRWADLQGQANQQVPPAFQAATNTLADRFVTLLERCAAQARPGQFHVVIPFEVYDLLRDTEGSGATALSRFHRLSDQGYAEFGTSGALVGVTITFTPSTSLVNDASAYQTYMSEVDKQFQCLRTGACGANAVGDAAKPDPLSTNANWPLIVGAAVGGLLLIGIGVARWRHV